MAADDDFELWLGSIGDRGRGGVQSFQSQVTRSTNLAGGYRRSGTVKRRFDGSRIGRGASVGRILSTNDRWSGARARRVVVKSRIVKLGSKGMGSAVAHLRYLQRDGTTRDGERGTLYSADRDVADGKVFIERGTGDRHQFRIIVAPEDGAEYPDLKPMIRRLMTQIEQDLGTKLDWVAVDHFNTGHPHSHIMLRGKDDRGKDLIIAREYMSHGLRQRAAELVNLDLGPRTEQEIFRAQQREVEAERFTQLDRRLLLSREIDGSISPRHPDRQEESFRTARLRRLETMGLASEEKGRWRLDPDVEPLLRRMGEHGDIIATMHREMSERAPERGPADYTIYDPAKASEPLVGRVISRGLSDEHADRYYLIVDAVDGHAHYVDIGSQHEPDIGLSESIVRITPRAAQVRDVDRTVADVAAANGGSYNVDLHLRHDRLATETFVQTHVRRLEAIRRATGAVEREKDGTWRIAPDHLNHVTDYERRQVERVPVAVQQLSNMPLASLPGHDGVTWLDRQLVGEERLTLGRGFGAEVRDAVDRRRQWLVEQELAETDGTSTRFRANLLAALRQRELRRVAAQLSNELGLEFTEARRGELIEGRYVRAVQIGGGKFALIEKSREFTLVPWRPVLERELGKEVGGIMRDSGVSWRIGRDRGLGIS